MHLLPRKLRGASTRAAIALSLAAFASPLAAQKTILNASGGTITFPAPTAADYVAGFVDSPTGVTFNVNAQTGASRTTTVTIRSTSVTLGNGKVIGDLQWRRSDLATWNDVTLIDAQVEQRIVIRNRVIKVIGIVLICHAYSNKKPSRPAYKDERVTFAVPPCFPNR